MYKNLKVFSLKYQYNVSYLHKKNKTDKANISITLISLSITIFPKELFLNITFITSLRDPGHKWLLIYKMGTSSNTYVGGSFSPSSKVKADTENVGKRTRAIYIPLLVKK